MRILKKFCFWKRQRNRPKLVDVAIQSDICGSTLDDEEKRVTKLEHRCSDLFYRVCKYEVEIMYLLEKIADINDE